MSMKVKGFYISYRIGDNYAEVRKIGYIDAFGRLCNMKLVFRGTWEQCKEFAEKGGEYE